MLHLQLPFAYRHKTVNVTFTTPIRTGRILRDIITRIQMFQLEKAEYCRKVLFFLNIIVTLRALYCIYDIGTIGTLEHKT
jgi:hypothetical protein